jgi:hypothetical protein
MTRAKKADLLLVSYLSVRHHIRDSDLLLFRAHDLIALAGRGEHCHAAKAAWWGNDLFCLEVRQWVGGRAVTLSSLVARWPGKIDVYQANPDHRWLRYDRAGAVRLMRRLCGCQYGYAALAKTAVLHAPLVRWFVAPKLDREAPDGTPPFCSQACSMADRLGGGVDPVEHLPDYLTEPADLARSPFYRYRFTLMP